MHRPSVCLLRFTLKGNFVINGNWMKVPWQHCLITNQNQDLLRKNSDKMTKFALMAKSPLNSSIFKKQASGLQLSDHVLLDELFTETTVSPTSLASMGFNGHQYGHPIVSDISQLVDNYFLVRHTLLSEGQDILSQWADRNETKGGEVENLNDITGRVLLFSFLLLSPFLDQEHRILSILHVATCIFLPNIIQAWSHCIKL